MEEVFSKRLAGVLGRRAAAIKLRRVGDVHSVGKGDATSAAWVHQAGLLPGDVDPARRERHLSDDEFRKVFGVGPAAFDAWPGWKQASAKKKAGLF